MPAANGNDLRSAFQISFLIKDIDKVLFPLGQKQGNQRYGKFQDPHNDQQDPAKNNQKAKNLDEQIWAREKYAPKSHNAYPKKRCQNPTLDLNPGIEPLEKVCGHCPLIQLRILAGHEFKNFFFIFSALRLSRKYLSFKGATRGPTPSNAARRTFFLLAAPSDSAGPHLKALARVSRLLKDKYFRESLKAAKDKKEILDSCPARMRN